MRSNAKANLCIWLVLSGNCYGVQELLEFMLGPKLGNGEATPKCLHSSPAQDLVEHFGYPFEVHEVSSESGYILTLHRIPYGKKSKKRKNRPVVLFQHGMVSASDMWLFQGPDRDLLYNLADSGYDVWISNMRGNVYSKAHKTLDPDRDREYWEFSLHEVAYEDLPAIIDYILNLTKQSSLYFIGHSIGSTVGMILCILRPEYNSKIRLHLALAPLIYVKHRISFAHTLLLLPAVPVMKTAIVSDIYNVFPRRPTFSRLVQELCRDGTFIQRLCLFLTFLLVGTDYEQFDLQHFPNMSTYFPAGTSTYVVEHILQIYLKGAFSALDYGLSYRNLAKYNQTDPPVYNLTRVTHPIAVHYGKGDLLVTEADVSYMEKLLPNSLGKYAVPFPKFNHMDFVWGIDAKKLLYEKLIFMMDKYR